MIDLADLRARPEEYQFAADHKNIGINVAHFLALDEERRTLTQAVEEMRAQKNAVSKDIPSLKGEEKTRVIDEMKVLGENLKTREAELGEVESRWKTLLLQMPMIPDASVPVGKSDADNVEVRRHGEPRVRADMGNVPLRDHQELGELLDIIDIPRGVKIAGSRSYMLKGDGARLHHAVLRFAADHLHAKGWTLFSPPLLAGWDCLMGTGFFPGAEEQTYAVGAERVRGEALEKDDLFLIGTAEVSVCSYHKDEVLHLADLPARYAGVSSCFRREAGTYGKDTRGLYRVHQFDKVEQVVLCENDAEKAMQLFEEIRTNAEEILQALELPYRILHVCTGDMGQGKVFMQDIETWMPSRDAYGETHSCSYLGDFQSRRLNIKYEDVDGTKRYVHTLNNTAIASPRILIPLLEVYQRPDGSVDIPAVLRPYMGGQERVERR